MPTPKDPNVFKQLYSTVIDGVGNFFNKQEHSKAIASVRGGSLFGFDNTGIGGITDPKKGLMKPGRVTFDVLRQIAVFDSLIRICITVIKKEVSQAKWGVVARPGKEVDENNVAQIEELFLRLNGNGENLRLLLDRVLEDLLVLDAGVIEKVFNAKGELMELNSVDGATIRPVYDKHGNLNPARAYVQVINDKVVAEFKLNEIIYMMQNPRNDVRTFGYGLSPIESILLAVQASLNADVYNAQTFSKDNIPPGILDLGGMSDSEARQFMAMWNATVINNTQKLKFVWGSDNAKKYTPFVQNNKDMQFVEYIDWLSRIKLATYGLTTMDANITQDVNRATAEVQQSITESRGILTIKRLVEEYFNREILMPMGFENEMFQFEEAINLEDRKRQAEIDQIYINNGVQSPTAIAEREGFMPVEEDFMDEDLNDGGSSPNPADGEVEVDEALEEKGKGKKKKNTKYFKPLYS